MDEDISIINSNTRNEKIKNFFIQNKNKIILCLGVIVILLISYFAFGEYQDNKKIKISDNFNLITINYSESNKEKTAEDLIQIINEKNSTYSPLALYTARVGVFYNDTSGFIELSNTGKGTVSIHDIIVRQFFPLMNSSI